MRSKKDDITGRFLPVELPDGEARTIIKYCKNCNKEMIVKYYLKDRKEYCCKKCFYEGRPYKGIYVKGHTHKVPQDKRGHNEETRKKIKETCIKTRIFGEQHPNYKNGLSYAYRQIKGIPEYVDWRTSVFKRDNYKCVECGFVGYLEVHHKTTLKELFLKHEITTHYEAIDIPEFWDIDNGITLCRPCHENKHFKKKVA